MNGERIFGKFDAASLIHPPQALQQLVERLTAHPDSSVEPLPDYSGSERRVEARYRVSLPVSIQQLDDSFQPTKEEFAAVTRDISTSGLGLLLTQSIDSQFLALNIKCFEGEELGTIIKVLRCQPRGLAYDVGGKFVMESASGSAN